MEPGVYRGATGCLLALAAAARSCSDRKLLDATIERAHRFIGAWPGSRPGDDEDYSLLHGRAGIGWTFGCLSQWCDDARMAAFARSCFADTDWEDAVGRAEAEWEGGVSGMVWAFLERESQTRSACPSIGRGLQAAAERLVDLARPGWPGLSWGGDHHCVRPLCGFSHGVAGVLFALGMLANRSTDADWRWLAAEAGEYLESAHVPGHGWFDYRSSEPTAGGTTWCNGSTGIALAYLRLRSDIPQLGADSHVREALSAVQSELASMREPPPLGRRIACHGLGGHIDFLLECRRAGYEVEGALRLGLDAFLPHGPEDAEDADNLPLGLFTGLASLVYTAVRIADPVEYPSVLTPPSREPVGVLGSFDIRLRLRKSLWPRTHEALVTRGDRWTGASLALHPAQSAPQTLHHHDTVVRDATDVDARLLAVERATSDRIELYEQALQRRSQRRALVHLSDQALLDLRLALDPRLELLRSRWMQDGERHVLDEEPRWLLLRPGVQRPSAVSLGRLQGEVLELLRRPQQAKQLVEALADRTGLESTILWRPVAEALRASLRSGFIVPHQPEEEAPHARPIH